MAPIAVTIEEAAEMLNVHPNTIRKLLPRIGAVDLNAGIGGNRLIRIPVKNIEAYIRNCVIQNPMVIRKERPASYKIERRRA